MRLAAMDDLSKEQLREAPEGILQNAGENVTKAIAARSSPKPPLVIGLLLVVGLVVGIAVALRLERSRWAEAPLRNTGIGPSALLDRVGSRNWYLVSDESNVYQRRPL